MSVAGDFSLESVISRSQDLMEAEADGELVALNIDNGACYRLNPVAARIWKLTSEPLTFSAIQSALLAEYEIDPATCETQLRDLLAELHREKLIEVRNA